MQCWKFSVLAIGAVQGMQAGLAGLRSGAQWAAGSSRARVEGLARWAPEMALAAGTVPPLKARRLLPASGSAGAARRAGMQCTAAEPCLLPGTRGLTPHAPSRAPGRCRWPWPSPPL